MRLTLSYPGLMFSILGMPADDKLRSRLPPKPPDDERDHDADDDRGGEREVERKPLPADEDVAGQPAEPQLADHRPEQADDQDDKANGDEELLHSKP